MKAAPFTKDELGRLMTLADLNVDYSNIQESFRDLAKLAAKVSGSPISMINLIDSYTTWTISNYGFDVDQTPRDESICQYTIHENEFYQVSDLSVDPMFKDEGFVTDGPKFRFYFGVPLSAQNHNLGALCVLDKKAKELPAEKIELLKIIADEIMNRLKTMQYVESLQNKVTEVRQTQNRVIHDIRGPIAGIIGLADIMKMQGRDNNIEEVLEFIGLIYKGGKSVLELADEILGEEKRLKNKVKRDDMLLQTFKQRLEQLYTPQARSKNIQFAVNVLNAGEDISFPQNKLMQIAGNLISNAIKFTPKWGDVVATLDVVQTETNNTLYITVRDTGAGISAEQIAALLSYNTASSDGTNGEKGYGFGLALVKHLLKGLNGTLKITSKLNEGTIFEVTIPESK